MPVDTAKLTEPFPPAALKSLRGFTYVQGHTVIHRLIDATDNQFDVDVRGIDTRDVKVGEKVATLYLATVALTIPGLGTRTHVGVQMAYAGGGEDMIKGAVTDGIKKAATLFGVGLELYGPDYLDDDQPAQPASAPAQRPASPQTRQNAPGRTQGNSTPQPAPARASGPQDAPQTPSGSSVPMPTMAQINYLTQLGATKGLTDVGVDLKMHTLFPHVADRSDLTRAEISQLIEALKALESPPKGNRPQPTPVAPPTPSVAGERGYDTAAHAGAPADEPFANAEQIRSIVEQSAALGADEATLLASVKKRAGVDQLTDLSHSQAEKYLVFLAHKASQLEAQETAALA